MAFLGFGAEKAAATETMANGKQRSLTPEERRKEIQALKIDIAKLTMKLEIESRQRAAEAHRAVRQAIINTTYKSRAATNS